MIFLFKCFLSLDNKPDANEQWLLKYPAIYENRRYAPSDLLLILKDLDTQISQYESMLIDEIEKRKKYKVNTNYEGTKYDISWAYHVKWST